MTMKQQRLAVLAILVAAACGCDLRPIVVPPGGLTGDASMLGPGVDATSSSDASYQPDAGFADSYPFPDAGIDAGQPSCDGATPLVPDGAPLRDGRSSCVPVDGGDAGPGDDAPDADASDDATPDDSASDDTSLGG